MPSSPRVLLIYPVRDDFAPNRGILNKMRYQADALRSLGFELTTVVGSQRGVVVNESETVPYRWSSGGRAMRVLNHYGTFWRLVASRCPAQGYDLVYIRYPGTNPALLAFLSWVKSRNPDIRVLLEFASYPMSGEADSLEQKLIVATDQLLSPFLRRLVDHVVTFGSQDEIHGISCIRSSNGIDVNAVPMRHARSFDPRAPQLLGVASLAKWHGYDRVLHGLHEALRREPTTVPHVHFAGHGPAAAELKRLARSLGLDERVTFHGMTTGKELDLLFDRCDIAIASLGMHRIGLQSASSLKTREYCARGIPFVFAGRDDSFGPDFPFALRVPVGEAPIDMGSILAQHAIMLAHNQNPATQMRAYAASHLSWRTRLDEIMQVALA